MPSVNVTPAATVDELVAFVIACDGRFDSLGPDGDPIDILAHSLQCAAVLAARSPDDVELQIAGLVHDLGHVVEPTDPVGHGEVGAAFVRPLLGARVARLVELHVPAKRYLVTTDTRYAKQLSGGSTVSLAMQGGRMSPQESAEYELDVCAQDAATLRRADEAAKVIGRTVPGIETWIPVLRAVADRSR